MFTVGTHEDPFDRLVAAAEEVAQRTGERVVVQAGPSQVATPHCERVDFASPDQLRAWMAEARLVVLHGGPSTLHEVLDAGTLPAVVPRDPRFGEHVDDHQLVAARDLAVPVFTDIAELVGWIEAGSWPDAPASPRSALATEAFCEQLDALLRDISSSRVSGTGRIRAILASLSRRFPLGR